MKIDWGKLSFILLVVLILISITQAGYWKLGTTDTINWADNTTFVNNTDKSIRIERIKDLTNTTVFNATNKSLEGGDWWLGQSVSESELTFNVATQAELDAHISNIDNPHQVTLTQAANAGGNLSDIPPADYDMQGYTMANLSVNTTDTNKLNWTYTNGVETWKYENGVLRFYRNATHEQWYNETGSLIYRKYWNGTALIEEWL
jgi:hypothetical protein